MPQVDVDIDDDFHRDLYPAPRPSYKSAQVDRQIPPRSNQSTSTNSHSTESNYNGHSVDGDDDEDDDEYAGDDYQRQLQKASSFNVEQMIQMRESHSNFRDSLAPNQRPTEMGNALMRMDDGYRYHQQVNGNRSVSGSFIQQIPAATADGLTPLLQAARSGDLMLLNALIIQPGTDILRRDPVFGQTALHFAIRGGHMGVVQALLMPQLAGSIVNVADSRRNTALHLAAAKSRRMTKILLESGADVNFLNMRNQTPLGVHILTVTRDDPTLTETLLQYRANPNAPVDKSTTLHVALDKGLYQIAARLVRHGARLDLKDEAGKTVFDKVDHNILKMLLSKVTFAPVWVPDTDRDDCMECHKKFGSLGSRRHHCRMCGRLLCSACASCHIKGSQLPFQPRGKKKKAEVAKKKLRACALCFEITAEAVQSGRSTSRTSSRTSNRRP
ncbi:Myosin-like protein, partial [Globisporangium splendens]